jgi:hypothetical protein
MIGERLSPILVEIEETLWESEAHSNTKPDFPIKAFRAGVKIFMSVLMDKMWDLQESDNISMDDRINMSEKGGNDVRELVKTYTDIDCHELYNE